VPPTRVLPGIATDGILTRGSTQLKKNHAQLQNIEAAQENHAQLQAAQLKYATVT